MYDYDHILNGRLSRQRHQEIIHEAQEMRWVRTAQGNPPVSQRVVAPIRRVAYLVATLIR